MLARILEISWQALSSRNTGFGYYMVVATASAATSPLELDISRLQISASQVSAAPAGRIQLTASTDLHENII